MPDVESQTPDTNHEQDASTSEGQTPEWVRESPEDAYKALQAAREEAKNHRLKAKELAEAMHAAKTEAERAKLDEVGRLKAELEDWQKKYTGLETNLTTERYKSQLAGRVQSVDDALKLLDDEFVKDGQIDVTKFLEAKPYLAAQAPKPTVKNLNPATRTAVDMNTLIRGKAGL